MSRSVTVGDPHRPDADRADADPLAGTPDEDGIAARRRRRLAGLGALAALLVLSALLSLLIGAKLIPPAEVWTALWHPDTANGIVIHDLRLPRTWAGVLAGAALGLAGALLQGHTRNPIAAPSILGITQGAGLAVVLAVFTLGITTMLGFIWFSFGGALLAALAVFAVGSIGRGGATPVALALAGAAISALLQAVTSALVLLDRQSLDTYRFWKVGSIAVTDTALIWQVLPFLLFGLVLGLANAAGLNALSLGEDVARSLGHHVGWSRAAGIAAIAVLVGSAVAMCGPIGFVGLIVPHVARFLAGADHRWLLPFSALMGSCLVLLADIVGRIVARPSEIQVGVMLAMVGAPFFIALVRRRKLVRL
ncbi:iron complex transport system permease protein [Halopolyspora algeriensis]|uniref:Iron complex transport system permease protein n=1 Tax=Halopolyspora algeriensis TaxID=1500506 RepID=A0A368VIX6_9ACTN|nr:iron ABC transporter permease [Halopolyspora algeriensis]RCW40164.1 iron complex transport system permease protein [Halopolyspora algeriensis]TQM46354.1 iron complex transport system permease protein [Halopolyspora algeriensis]